MVLKTWQNQVRGEHRPTFVLENSAQFFRLHGIVQGDAVRICAVTDTTNGGCRLVMGRSTDLPAPPPQAPPPQPIYTVSQSRVQPVVGFDVVGKVRKTGGRGGGRGVLNNNGSSYHHNHHNHHQGIFSPDGNEADGAARALLDLMKHGVLPSGNDDSNCSAVGSYDESMSGLPFLTAFAASLTNRKPIIIQPQQQKEQQQQQLLQPLQLSGIGSSLPSILISDKSTMITTGDDWGNGGGTGGGITDIGGLISESIFKYPDAISIISSTDMNKYPYETDSPRDCLLPWKSKSPTPADEDDHHIKMMQSMMMNTDTVSGDIIGEGKQQQHVLMKPIARRGGLFVVTTGVSGPQAAVALPQQQQQQQQQQ
jgi:hypothetical protein